MTDNPYDLAHIIQWTDACSTHAQAHKGSRLHQMQRNPDGSYGDSSDDVYAWRATLAANREAGINLPEAWCPIYYAAVLTAFDHDPTVRAIAVSTRLACITVEWSHATGLNVDVEMELRSRATCDECGQPGKTHRTSIMTWATRCAQHISI